MKSKFSGVGPERLLAEEAGDSGDSLTSTPNTLSAMSSPSELLIPYPPDAVHKRQAFEVPGTRRPGQTGEFPLHLNRWIQPTRAAHVG
jgi:hypothetical protein